MNRVYKVIWSKAKHCYVVTSEIARSVTKSASSARSVGRKGAAVLAMAALLFTAGGMLGEAANPVVTDVALGGTANVITITKDDSSSTSITIDNVAHAQEAGYATEATKAYSDGKGLVIESTYAKKAEVESTYAKAADVESTYTKKEDFEKLKGIVGEGQEDGNYVAKGETLSASVNHLDTQVKANADAVGQETVDRKLADKDNLKVDGDGVISQVTGDDGTTSSPVNKLVLNKDGDNQITMDEKGIKVGTNSTIIASDGVFAGGDTATAAKAALNADGSIKGANGKFTVDANGKVTANGGVDTNGGNILTLNGSINAGFGDISGKDISASGSLHADGDISGKDISGKDITGSGTVTGHAVTDGTARMEGGALKGVTTITAGGDVVSTGGKVQGTSVSDGIATLSGGSLTDAVNITASGTITGNNVDVKDKLTTKNLEVTGVLKTDHITLGSETNNYTDIDKGKVTSEVQESVGAVEYTAESIFNKDGSSITARTDEGAVDSTGKSKVGAQGISQYLGNNAEPKSSDKNVTRNMVRNDNGTFSMEDKAVDGDKSSTVSQNAEERKVVVDDGTKTLTVTENLTGGIVSETNDGAGKTVTLTQGMDGTYKVETSGTSTEEIGGQKIENYKGGLATEITGDETHHVTENQTNTVDGTLNETVAGDVTEEYQKDLSTTVGGKQTTTVTGDSSLSAENINNTATKALTNDANTITNKAHESVTTQIGDGLAVKSVMDVNGIANTATGKAITNDATTITNTGIASVTNKVGDNQVLVETNQVKSAFGDTIYTTWDESGITDKVGENVERTMGTKKITESVKDGTKSNTFTKTADKDINTVTDGTNTSTESQLAGSVNTSLKVVDAEGKTTQSLSNVKTVSDDTTKITDTTKNAFSSSSQKADSITTTVKDTKTGTISERSQTVSQVQDKVGTTTVTTTDGLTKLTNEAGTHKTEMDSAEVLKDLGVRGNAVVDGTSTLKGE